MAASPANINLRLEASGHKRVGNLLYMLKTRSRTVDSCAMLREVWSENPLELYSEILDWFHEDLFLLFSDLFLFLKNLFLPLIICSCSYKSALFE
ncbi:hypothetical protein LguiB_012909 [Lonicera macranthoides]